MYLVTNMQCIATCDATEELLARAHAPAFITNVYKDIVAAVERAEGEASADRGQFLFARRLAIKNLQPFSMLISGP